MTSMIEVSGQRLRQNVRAIERVLAEAVTPAPPPHLLAVVKANAYGHGATLCAPILAHTGVPWLGVTDALEGVAVRESLAASTAHILLMSGPPGDAPGARMAAAQAVQYRLTPVVWTPAHLPPIAAAAASRPHPVHLEIDTGMSRQGVAPGRSLQQLLAALRNEPRLQLDGVFTHLASAEQAGAHQTAAQMLAFEAAVETVHAAGFTPLWIHLGNASTVDNGAPSAACTIPRLGRLAASIGAQPMVRCGLALYGHCLPIEGESATPSRLRPLLRPVLTWRTWVTSVAEVAAGTPIGYSATYTAPQSMRLALVPVGYADGLRRGLSSTNTSTGGWVMIHNQPAPMLGRVSMNLTSVDVTHIRPHVQAGDVVVLLGDGISAEDHARLAGALPYEILCGLRGAYTPALDSEALPPSPTPGSIT